VKVIGGGITVDGDPMSVYRVHELWADAKALLATVRKGAVPKLAVIANNTLITANDEEVSVPRRAMVFLTHAVAAGADPAKMRHLAGAYLAAHGYPWPWVLHKLGHEHGLAYVACRRFGSGTALAKVLAKSLDEASW
jgi:hypothetical protein